MPVTRKIQSINLYIAWSFKDFLNIHVWNVYIFENKLYRSFLALYNEYNVKIISTLYNWMPKISKIFSIFTSEMFILLKKALSSSFLVSYAACSRVRDFLPTYRLLTAATHSIPIVSTWPIRKRHDVGFPPNAVVTN
jgi:hypothetical protein